MTKRFLTAATDTILLCCDGRDSGLPLRPVSDPSGRILEGSGVVPDIAASVDRDLLLQGRGSKLETALSFLSRGSSHRPGLV